MLLTSVTHYWPHDGDEQKAACGAPMRETAHTIQHSTTPTCPYCQAWLALADITGAAILRAYFAHQGERED